MRKIPGVNTHIFKQPNIPWNDVLVNELLDSVIAKFPNTLANGEESNIRTVVRQMYNTGVWQQHDYFFGWFLTDETNALTSWKGTKTATNVASATFNEFGVLTDGSSSYINTGIVPSTDLTNASLNDIHLEAYCYDNLSVLSQKNMFGCQDATNKIFIQQRPDVNNFTFQVNSTGFSAGGGGSSLGLFQDNTRYGIHRGNSSNNEIYIDGTKEHTAGDASSGLVNEDLVIGCRNNNGVFDRFLNARQSYFCIGGGYDLTALNTSLNLVQSLFNLD